jgi:UPF0716 family protein affecting phage T7 exclusion
MFGILFLLLLLVPIAELWIIVQVSGEIGFLNTIGLLVLISVAGAGLLKQQGLQTYRELQATVGRGEIPTKQLTDGAMILFGGALLLTPGFLTDAVGLLLLLPPTRAVLKGSARAVLARWAGRRARRYRTYGSGGWRVYETTVTRSRREEPSRPPPGPSPEELASPDRPGEDDSPDKEE